jgi:hypothetical protein
MAAAAVAITTSAAATKATATAAADTSWRHEHAILLYAIKGSPSDCKSAFYRYAAPDEVVGFFIFPACATTVLVRLCTRQGQAGLRTRVLDAISAHQRSITPPFKASRYIGPALESSKSRKSAAAPTTDSPFGASGTGTTPPGQAARGVQVIGSGSATRGDSQLSTRGR